MVVVFWQGFLHGLKKKDAVVDGDHGVALDEVGPGLFDALFASLSMILVSEVLLSGELGLGGSQFGKWPHLC